MDGPSQNGGPVLFSTFGQHEAASSSSPSVSPAPASNGSMQEAVEDADDDCDKRERSEKDLPEAAVVDDEKKVEEEKREKEWWEKTWYEPDPVRTGRFTEAGDSGTVTGFKMKRLKIKVGRIKLKIFDSIKKSF